MKAVSFLCLLLCTSALAASWTSCGSDSDPFKLQAMDLMPDPPKRGQDLTIKVQGISDILVDGGKVDTTVKYLGVTVANEHDDLCEMLAAGGNPCPIQPGTLASSIKTVNIPSVAPTFGKLEATVEMKDKDGNRAACYKLSFKVSS
eukprot:GILI01001487.1.p1 GENE.GILI01001487.1~~GILI01001487.1.p1  ORF type:complete len:159 (-),score=70.91 GILI01001487.1:219-656(-)